MAAARSLRLVLAGLGSLVVVSSGCSGRRSPAPDSAAVHPSATPQSSTASHETTAVAAPTTAECPEVGVWQACSVEDRIERAGLVARRGAEPVHHDFMHVPGIVYTTSRAEIQVFLYRDSTERARDTNQLDSATVSPRGQRAPWKEPATLVTSNNLAAIIITLNDRQAERIALALGAGLPAAPKR